MLPVKSFAVASVKETPELKTSLANGYKSGFLAALSGPLRAGFSCQLTRSTNKKRNVWFSSHTYVPKRCRADTGIQRAKIEHFLDPIVIVRFQRREYRLKFINVPRNLVQGQLDCCIGSSMQLKDYEISMKTVFLAGITRA